MVYCSNFHLKASLHLNHISLFWRLGQCFSTLAAAGMHFCGSLALTVEVEVGRVLVLVTYVQRQVLALFTRLPTEITVSVKFRIPVHSLQNILKTDLECFILDYGMTLILNCLPLSFTIIDRLKTLSAINISVSGMHF